MCISSPSHWEKPLPSLFKLKFDGASKGNPREAGFGGAIRDCTGTIQNVYWGDLGFDSNIEEALSWITERIHIAMNLNLLPLIAEGYSQIILGLATYL